MTKEFRDLTKTVERMAHVVVDRIDRMDGGHLSNVMTAMQDVSVRVEKMEHSLSKFGRDMSDLEIQIARLNTKIDIATKGITQ